MVQSLKWRENRLCKSERRICYPAGDYDVGDLDEINGLLVLKEGKTGKSGIFSVETGQQVIPFRYDGITFAGSDRLVVEKMGSAAYTI